MAYEEIPPWIVAGRSVLIREVEREFNVRPIERVRVLDYMEEGFGYRIDEIQFVCKQATWGPSRPSLQVWYADMFPLIAAAREVVLTAYDSATGRLGDMSTHEEALRMFRKMAHSHLVEFHPDEPKLIGKEKTYRLANHVRLVPADCDQVTQQMLRSKFMRTLVGTSAHFEEVRDG